MRHVPLLEMRDVTVQYRDSRTRNRFNAADAVSLSIGAGETVGLVGESGSGKSTIGGAVLGLVPVHAGTIQFDGRDITHADFRTRRKLSADLQVVFQDPYGSLNPARTVGKTLAEPIRVHERADRVTIAERVRRALEQVGLPADAMSRYPREFSGGQRQRIAIARALMLSPRLIVCDEPTSALDLSVQAQILNLLGSLQQSMNLSYLFISHDLAVVRHIAHRVVVLYQGRIVETGPTADVYANPSHPYTRALLAATPTRDTARRRRSTSTRPQSVAGATAPEGSPSEQGCSFVRRCAVATELCTVEQPALTQTASATYSACHHVGTAAGHAGGSTIGLP